MPLAEERTQRRSRTSTVTVSRVQSGRSPKRSKKNRTDVLDFPKEVIMVFEVCGSSGIAKLVLPDLVQDFTDFGATRIRFCEYFYVFSDALSAFYPFFPHS